MKKELHPLEIFWWERSDDDGNFCRLNFSEKIPDSAGEFGYQIFAFCAEALRGMLFEIRVTIILGTVIGRPLFIELSKVNGRPLSMFGTEGKKILLEFVKENEKLFLDMSRDEIRAEFLLLLKCTCIEDGLYFSDMSRNYKKAVGTFWDVNDGYEEMALIEGKKAEVLALLWESL